MQIFINIVVFIAALLIVICLHELGHFLVAKASNVYCYEFSIGFGPAIFKHKFKHKVKKKKNKDGEEVLFAALTDNLNSDGNKKVEKVEGETQFAIRCLPLGGYVSMAGEDGEDEDFDIKVPKERTLSGVNHFKQICIMLAGIVMNYILCFLLFFISFSFCPQTVYLNEGSNQVTVTENSAIYDAGVSTGDSILYLYQVYNNLYDENNNLVSSMEWPAVENRVELENYMIFDNASKTSGTFDELTYNSIAYASQNMLTITFDGNPFIGLKAGADSTREIYLTYEDAETEELIDVSFTLTATASESDGETTYSFDIIGISQMTSSITYGPIQGIKMAGQQFGTYFVGIYNALGSLFTASGWENVGGLISVYEMSAAGVESGSLGYVLFLWGYISLNLGCFNLLPIPGLDGWQTLLALGETVTRKKVNNKFKAIANTVGMILLLALGVGLIIKDLIL